MATSIFPLVNVTSSATLPHSNVIVHKKTALDVLEKNLIMPDAATPDSIGKQSGRTVQWFRPQNFGAPSLAQNNEINIPTGQSYVTKIKTATLGLYTDWVGIGSFQQDTSISPDIQHAGERLTYSYALRMDNVTRAVYDSMEPLMAATPQAGADGYLTIQDGRAQKHILWNADVKGMAKHQGRFLWMMNPLNAFDILKDPTVGGFADLVKYNTNVRDTPLFVYNDNVIDGGVAGCRIVVTTNVTSNTSGNNTYYWSYLMGEGGFGKVALTGSGPGQMAGDFRHRLTIHIGEGGFGPWDPTGQLGQFASYRGYYAAAPLAGDAQIGDVVRGKIIRARSSIG